jgi:3-oxoacyl-[acyl-carrier protein] reductase
METGLSRQVVLITGASGGIGSAIARAFAAEGCALALHYRSGRDRASRLDRDLSPTVPTLLVQADLCREPDVRRMFTTVTKRFGRIDVLVANAGSWETRDIPVHQMTRRQWQTTLDAVLTSTFLSARAFARLLTRQHRGNAVLIGSTAAVFGEAGHADYAAGKSALAFGLTRTLKNEFARIAPHTADYPGARVNCVCPGWTLIPRTAPKLRDPDIVRRVTATMALPKVARPEDVANAVVFFASDRLAGHITGQTLVVAGGMEGRFLWPPEEVDPTLA